MLQRNWLFYITVYSIVYGKEREREREREREKGRAREKSFVPAFFVTIKFSIGSLCPKILHLSMHLLLLVDHFLCSRICCQINA